MLAAAQIRVVAPSDLRLEHDVPDDFDASAVEASLALLGGLLQGPIANTNLEVLVGEHSVREAQRAGSCEMQVRIVDDATARIISLVANHSRRRLNPLEDCLAASELVAHFEKETPAQCGGDRKSTSFRESKFHGGNLKTAPAELASRILGVSKSAVYRRCRIAREGTPELHRQLADGKIGHREADSRVSGLKQKASKRRRNKRKKYQNVGLVTTLPTGLRRSLECLKQFRVGIEGHLNDITESFAVEIEREIAATLTLLRSSPKHAAEAEQTLDRQIRKAAVRIVETSLNSKLSPVQYPDALGPIVSATSVSIAATCPDSCLLKGAPGVPGGCFARAGITKGSLEKLDDAAHGFTGLQINEAEAQMISNAFGGGAIPQDGACGGRDLRIHESGEVEGVAGAQLLAKAARGWTDRGGGAVWSYTHRWGEVTRDHWGKISVLASVERAEDVGAAKANGYAAALLVDAFPSGANAFYLPGHATKFIPCPAETRGRTCATCRLCMDDQALLKRDAAIAFEIHGNHREAAKESVALVKLRRPVRPTADQPLAELHGTRKGS